MKTVISKIVVGFKVIRAFFPSAVPNGVDAFDSWARSFFEIYPMPTQDVTSVKYTLATIIMHMGPQTAFKSKFYFYLTLKAGAAKQVAGAIFYQIKQEQKAAEEAAKLEATSTPKVVASNEYQG